MVNGNLPGAGSITIYLEGTSLSVSVDAVVGEVADSSNKCSKVTASIASGTVVEKGTQVALSSETDDAVIYYTTNGTCPYYAEAEDKYIYTEPITIDGDIFIIAYAAKDGYENSNTAGFIYTVSTSDMESFIPGDLNGDGEVNASDLTKLAQYVGKIISSLD